MTGESYSLLTRYLAPHAWRLTAIALLLLLCTAAQLAIPFLIKNFIDTAVQHGPPTALTWIAATYLLLAAVSQLLYAALSYSSATLGWQTTDDLRHDLFLHCLRLDLSFHAQHAPGEMIGRIDADTALLSNFLSAFVLRVLSSLLIIIGAVAIAAAADWRLAVVLAVQAGASLCLLWFLQGRATPFFAQYQKLVGTFTGFWHERLSGVDDLRTAGGVPYVLYGHRKLAAELVRASVKALVMMRVVLGGWEISTAVGLAAFFLVAASLYDAGAITFGVVFLVYYYCRLVADNLVQITQQFEDLQRAGAGIGRISQLYGQRSRFGDVGRAIPPGPPTIEFRNVSFEYHKDTPVLRDVSFSLAPGEHLGLVGRTGSGKTTLVGLLERFHDATTGSVRISGLDAREIDIASLRSRTAIITQESRPLRASLRDNVTLFDASIPDDVIMRSADELGLSEWIAKRPQGLDTMISPETISAGEAQLIAAMRLFLGDQDLVILDEPSARIDPGTARAMHRAIERALVGRTAIIIAHRLAALDGVDKIVVLDKGMVRESGTLKGLSGDPASHFSTLRELAMEGSLR